MPYKDKKIRNEYSKQYRLNNPDKVKAYDKQHRLDNKESIAKAQYKYLLMKNYGITIEQYNDMFKQQEGRCLICHTHQDLLLDKLCVDHNHNTNAVRGLLCKSCNGKLGWYERLIEDIKLYLNETN